MYNIIGCIYMKHMHTVELFDFILCAKANTEMIKLHFSKRNILWQILALERQKRHFSNIMLVFHKKLQLLRLGHFCLSSLHYYRKYEQTIEKDNNSPKRSFYQFGHLSHTLSLLYSWGLIPKPWQSATENFTPVIHVCSTEANVRLSLERISLDVSVVQFLVCSQCKVKVGPCIMS